MQRICPGPSPGATYDPEAPVPSCPHAALPLDPQDRGSCLGGNAQGTGS